MEWRCDLWRMPMTFRLPSYIRTHRKRWHLSQRELAFLLGLSSQAVISQHESLARLPQTKVLLKYEALFGEPISVLFPRLHQDASDEVAVQVRALMEALDRQTGLSTAHKLELLQDLIHRLDARLP